MKLSAWAKSNGLTYKTAWRLWSTNQLPVPSEQLATGTILVHPPKEIANSVAIYTRVSSADQKADLDRQIARLTIYASDNDMQITKVVSEIGSGLNGKRPKLIQLLKDPSIKTIIVENKDRFARFGFEYVEAALAASGRNLVVINEDEINNDLVKDMIDVLTSFCARLYGSRSASNRARNAAIAAALEPSDSE